MPAYIEDSDESVNLKPVSGITRGEVVTLRTQLMMILKALQETHKILAGVREDLGVSLPLSTGSAEGQETAPGNIVVQVNTIAKLTAELRSDLKMLAHRL